MRVTEITDGRKRATKRPQPRARDVQHRTYGNGHGPNRIHTTVGHNYGHRTGATALQQLANQIHKLRPLSLTPREMSNYLSHTTVCNNTASIYQGTGTQLVIQLTQLSTQSTSIPITRCASRVQWSCCNKPTHTTKLVNTYVQVTDCMLGHKTKQYKQAKWPKRTVVSPDQVTTRRRGRRPPTVSSSACRLPWSCTPKRYGRFGISPGSPKMSRRGDFNRDSASSFELRKAPLG